MFARKRPTASLTSSILAYGILAFALIFAFHTTQPAPDAFSSQQPGVFSQQRAFNHLNEITQAPHYTGSHDHQRVQQYLVEQLEAMGLEVQVQKALATGTHRFTSSRVANIIARIKGNDSSVQPGKALALMTHYDSSTYSSYGASDAGSGVVTILEGVRAFIKSNQTHENDIIVLFTDAEEQGLLGAKAFVNQHPWADDIGLVLNFEARGSGGPSYMLLETNGGNQKLIKAFAEAAPEFAQANSLMYSIYKRLPNDTDLTVFREDKNISGFNFAFIDDHFDYHTAQDTATRLDPATLNHQANYLMTLLPYFANAPLDALGSTKDDVFFNFANLGMVQYPFDYALPLAGTCLMLLLALLVIGPRANNCSAKSILVACIPGVISMVTVVLLGLFGWQAMTQLYPQYLDIRHGFTYNGHSILNAFILISIAWCFSLYQWFKNRYSYLNTLSLGYFPLIIWTLLNLFISFYLTGASFFVLPLLGLLLALIYSAVWGKRWEHFGLLSAIMVAPGIIVLAPQIPTFVVGLGLPALVIATTLSALVTLLMLPGLVFVRGSQYIAKLCLIGAVGLFIHAHWNADYSPDRKKPTSVNYLYDSEENQAYLFSYNQQLDDFTQQFFEIRDVNQGQLDTLYPAYRRTRINFVRPTEALDFDLASYQVLEEVAEGELRKITLKIFPKRQNNMLQLITFSPLTIDEMHIENQTFENREVRIVDGTFMRHVVTDNLPLTVTFTARFEENPDIRLVETKFDLKETLKSFKQRTPQYMPEPFVYTDATILSQPIKL